MKNISKDMEKFLNASCVSSGRTQHLTHQLQTEGFLPEAQSWAPSKQTPGVAGRLLSTSSGERHDEERAGSSLKIVSRKNSVKSRK